MSETNEALEKFERVISGYMIKKPDAVVSKSYAESIDFFKNRLNITKEQQYFNNGDDIQKSFSMTMALLEISYVYTPQEKRGDFIAQLIPNFVKAVDVLDNGKNNEKIHTVLLAAGGEKILKNLVSSRIYSIFFGGAVFGFLVCFLLKVLGVI